MISLRQAHKALQRAADEKRRAEKPPVPCLVCGRALKGREAIRLGYWFRDREVRLWVARFPDRTWIGWGAEDVVHVCRSRVKCGAPLARDNALWQGRDALGGRLE